MFTVTVTSCRASYATLDSENVESTNKQAFFQEAEMAIKYKSGDLVSFSLSQTRTFPLGLMVKRHVSLYK